MEFDFEDKIFTSHDNADSKAIWNTSIDKINRPPPFIQEAPFVVIVVWDSRSTHRYR
jgi:hypothetical protein